MSDKYTVEVIQRGIEHYEAVMGEKPDRVVMPSGLMDELRSDPDFALCTEIDDPCAEYALRGVRFIIDNRLKDEARMS